VKNILLLTTTFLAITPPAFGMFENDSDAAKEGQRRTITVIADLNNPDPNGPGTLRVYQKPMGRLGRGEFYTPSQDYQYDYDHHRFSFGVQFNEPQLYEFFVSYTPFRTGFSNEELTYSYHFKADIPGDENDRTVQATLLSIELDSPAHYGLSYERKIKKIYEKK
jgi:hypothetical protein